MYKYLIVLVDGREVEFESKVHISMLRPVELNGALVIGFSDADVFLNVRKTKEIWIDGYEYPYFSKALN